MDGLMDELLAFLHTRLDEDERIARAARGMSDQPEDKSTGEVPIAGDEDDALEHWSRLRPQIARIWTPEIAKHIARHDPARVIRDTDAKRQILRHITPELDAGSGGVDSNEFGDELAHWTRLLTIARFFAQAYAEHPDYREEWQP